MVNPAMTSEIKGRSIVSIEVQAHRYDGIEVLIMKNLCTDFLITFLKNHFLIIDFCENKPPLESCSLGIANVTPVSLFTNLTPDFKPVITKSRWHILED